MTNRSALSSLVLTLGIATACGGREQSGSAFEPPAVSARLAVAERVLGVGRVELAGTVVAEHSTTVSSRVLAMVTAVHVEMGDEVRSGQALLSIDPAVAEGQVAQASGALAQAEAALVLARRNHERFQALAATRSASELEVDLARMQYEQARGAAEQAQGSVTSARSVARESLVVAPLDGRVAARLVEIGELVTPGRPLVRVDSRVGRRLMVSIPETVAAAAGLTREAPIAVTLDAWPELGELAGRIAEISPGSDPVAHAYTVAIDLPPFAGDPIAAGHPIAAGAAGRAWLPTGERVAVRVPRDAVIESGGLSLVVVRDPEGRAQSRFVTVGRVGSDGRVEILSGLAGGESVALGLAVAPAAGAPLEVLP